MTESQSPMILVNGAVRGWDAAVVHLTSETALRGMNVFDGLRAYWSGGGRRHQIVELGAHLERLERSCAHLRFPLPETRDRIASGIAHLVSRFGEGTDLYLRATVYLERGGYTVDPAKVHAGWYVAAYPVASAGGAPTPTSAVLSRWRKHCSDAFPTGVKAGGCYLLTRLARIEAADAGAGEAILLNHEGRVCEAPGANVVLLKNGHALSPAPSEGALDGITLSCVGRILQRHLAVPLALRAVLVEELFSADEVFLCGTLNEITPLGAINGQAVGDGTTGPVTARLAELYQSEVRAIVPAGERLVNLFEVHS